MCLPGGGGGGGGGGIAKSGLLAVAPIIQGLQDSQDDVLWLGTC